MARNVALTVLFAVAAQATPLRWQASSFRRSTPTIGTQKTVLARAASKDVLLSTKTTKLFPQQFNVLYDSKCSLCQYEINFLKSKDKEGKLFYTDIESPTYDENDPVNGRLTYEEAMKVMHAVTQDGEVVEGADVFPAIYKAIGLGWVYAWAEIPFIGPLYHKVYNYWAKYRTEWTRGRTLQSLFDERKQCETCTTKAGTAAAESTAEIVGDTARPPSLSAKLYNKISPDSINTITAALIGLLVGSVIPMLRSAFAATPRLLGEKPLVAS